MRRIRLGVLLRVASCAIVAGLTMELCARLDDLFQYGAPFWAPYNIEQIYEFDAAGRRGKPNAQFRKWKLNSLGYRGPEPTPGSTRIVVFGASETFGLYEERDNEYPRLLEKQLNERAGEHRFDVINAAYAGMPLAAMIPRVPDVVSRVRPAYALIYPTPSTYIWLPWLRPEQEPAQPRFDIRIKDQVRTIAKQLTPVPVLNWMREREIDREANRYGKVMDRLPEENITRFTDDLRQLASALRSHAAEPVLVTHAHRFSDPPTAEDRDMLLSWRKFYPMLSENGFLDMEKRMNNAVRALGSSEDYIVIDAGARIPPGSRNFADFTHFTDEGSTRMAHVLADGLYPLVRNCCASAAQLASNPQP